MTETNFHSRWINGTATERAAYSTTYLPSPTFWYETDADTAMLWNGFGWWPLGDAWLYDILVVDPDGSDFIKGTYLTRQSGLNSAMSAAASGDFVLLPPTALDITVTLKDGVQIHGPYTTLNYTSGASCVAAADGGYINVKEIQCTRGSGQNATGVDISGLGAGESCEVYAELVKASNANMTGLENVYAIEGGGSGTAYIFAKYLDVDVTENGGGNNVSAVYADGDTVYVFADSRVDNDADGSGAFTNNLHLASGTVYWRGRMSLTSDSGAEGYNVYQEGGTLYVWGDGDVTITGAGSTGYGLSLIAGTAYVYGNTTVDAVAYSYGAHVDGATAYLYGRFYAETSGNLGTEYAIGVYGSGGAAELHGDGLAVGVNGNRYGVWCAGGTLTHYNGLASGATQDTYRSGGTFSVYSVRLANSLTSGTITYLDNLDGRHFATVANDQTIGGATIIFPIAIAGGAAGNTDITITQKIRVVDAWAVHTGGAGEASDTIQVLNVGNAITDAMDWSGADTALVRASQINDANHTISSGGTLRVTTTDNDAGNDVGAGIVYVLAIPSA